MKYSMIVLSNKNKALLVDFERTIHETEPEIWPSPFEESVYVKQLEANDFETDQNKVVCCLYGDKIIARCDVVIQNSLMDFEKTGYVDWIYVEKNFRKKGIGKSLMAYTLEYVKSMGISSVYLFTAGNDEAQGFYKSFDGFTYENREVAVLCERIEHEKSN